MSVYEVVFFVIVLFLEIVVNRVLLMVLLVMNFFG